MQQAGVLLMPCIILMRIQYFAIWIPALYQGIAIVVGFASIPCFSLWDFLIPEDFQAWLIASDDDLQVQKSIDCYCEC